MSTISSATTPNRKEAPSNSRIEQPYLNRPLEVKLDNGIPVVLAEEGDKEITRIELLFKAGTWYQDQPLQATAANAMILEGTPSHTGRELAEKIDHYGAFVQHECEKDSAVITLFTLNRYLDDTIALLEEMIKTSRVPEAEFDIYVRQQRSSFEINSQKVSMMARKQFTRALFPNGHRYGRLAEAEDFEALQPKVVRQFLSRWYRPEQLTILVSGKAVNEVLPILNQRFGQKDWAKTVPASPEGEGDLHDGGAQYFVPKTGAVQSAIRIGRTLFRQDHPDYIPFQVLNTMLGGYFGSRLMSNLREDKGYTYGIGSGMLTHLHAGLFSMATEVKADIAHLALEEIYKEIDLLRNEPPSASELDRVMHYMAGQFLRSVSGPFAQADRARSKVLLGFDDTYFDTFLDRMRSVSSEYVSEMANRYLQKKHLVEVVAGQCEGRQ